MTTTTRLPRLRTAVLVLVTALATVIAALAVPSTPADAAIDSGMEQDFLCRTNAERRKAGVARLRVADDLVRVARRHSVRMADQNHLHHNPNLASDVRSWRRVGENVGRGPSVSSLHTALMNSPGHRRNLLDSSFTEVGIGVERRGSQVWVTQVFRTPSGSTSSRAVSCGGSSGGSSQVASGSSSRVPSGGIPVSGDWNGNGRETAGVFKDGVWYLSNSHTSGADRVVHFGRRGDIPVVGDWNGTGRDTIGIVRDDQWHLKNSLSGGRPDIRFTYGRVTRGDIPLVGDWNGTGRDTIGIVRDGQWHLRNRLSGGRADIRFTYGRVTRGDIPVVGDWNGSGRSGPGIVRSDRWLLRNSPSGGAASRSFRY
jgi:uncharacterized protein YkwD